MHEVNNVLVVGLMFLIQVVKILSLYSLFYAMLRSNKKRDQWFDILCATSITEN